MTGVMIVEEVHTSEYAALATAMSATTKELAAVAAAMTAATKELAAAALAKSRAAEKINEAKKNAENLAGYQATKGTTAAMFAADFAVHALSCSKTEAKLTSAWNDDELWQWRCILINRKDHQSWANFQKVTDRRLQGLCACGWCTP